MVEKRIFIELILGLVVLIAYFVYFLMRYRKSPHFLNGVLWGIGAFFIAHSFMNMILLGASVLVEKEIIPLNDFIGVLVSSLARGIGVVFSAFFAFKLMKRKGHYDSKTTPSLVGFMSGSGILASPFNANAHAVAFVQLLTNAFFVNRDVTQSDLGKVPMEQVEAFREMFATTPVLEFLVFAVYGLVLALGFVFIYRLVAKVYDEEDKFKKTFFPFVFGFAYYFVVEGVTLMKFSPLSKITVLVAAGALAYVSLNKLLLKK